jgi:hydrogenase nickel incorporation protein HypB
VNESNLAAAVLRGRFDAAGVFVTSLMSSPGSGKTAFLERTLASLQPMSEVAALVSGVATGHDAERLSRTGARVHQIETEAVSHLDADMVERAIAGWNLNALDCLFIENVGNLVGPRRDLGEAMRVVLLSVTEGEDKPLKYPTLFSSADLVVVTKIELAETVGFDRRELLANINLVNSDLPVLEVSARTGRGFQKWLGLVESRRASCAALTGA